MDNKETYTYRPVRFYILVFALTWGFWFLAGTFQNKDLMMTFMLLGLLMPALIAITTVFTSKSKVLKEDFIRKIIGFYRINPSVLLKAIIIYGLVILASIATSVLFGGTLNQLTFTEDFSFSVAGTPALLTLILASVIEEVGWRGYGEDAVGQYHSWFKESVLFGFIWSSWHLPLFWVPGTYHHGLTEMGVFYVLNFLVSVMPFVFIQTWVYVKNNRSMIATIIFHLFVNLMQEKIAMTPQTKCIQTIFITIAGVLVVLMNRELFFETEHVGRLLESQFKEADVNES